MNEQSLQIFPFVFARSCGLLAVLPLQDLERNWIGRLLLALVFGLNLSFAAQTGPMAAIEISPFNLAAEAALGALLGLPLIFVVSAAVLAGELIDAGRGQTIAQAYDPISNSQASITAILFGHYAFAYLLAAGGGTILYLALLRSVAEMPPAMLSGMILSSLAYKTVLQALLLLMDGVIFVLPLLIVLGAVEFLIGWIPKLAPGMQLQGEAFIIKSIVSGLFLISCLALAF